MDGLDIRDCRRIYTFNLLYLYIYRLMRTSEELRLVKGALDGSLCLQDTLAQWYGVPFSF